MDTALCDHLWDTPRHGRTKLSWMTRSAYYTQKRASARTGTQKTSSLMQLKVCYHVYLRQSFVFRSPGVGTCMGVHVRIPWDRPQSSAYMRLELFPFSILLQKLSRMHDDVIPHIPRGSVTSAGRNSTTCRGSCAVAIRISRTRRPRRTFLVLVFCQPEMSIECRPCAPRPCL